MSLKTIQASGLKKSNIPVWVVHHGTIWPSNRKNDPESFADTPTRTLYTFDTLKSMSKAAPGPPKSLELQVRHRLLRPSSTLTCFHPARVQHERNHVLPFVRQLLRLSIKFVARLSRNVMKQAYKHVKSSFASAITRLVCATCVFDASQPA